MDTEAARIVSAMAGRGGRHNVRQLTTGQLASAAMRTLTLDTACPAPPDVVGSPNASQWSPVVLADSQYRVTPALQPPLAEHTVDTTVWAGWRGSCSVDASGWVLGAMSVPAGVSTIAHAHHWIMPLHAYSRHTALTLAQLTVAVQDLN